MIPTPLMPPPGLAPQKQTKIARKPRRECAHIGNYIIFGGKGRLFAYSIRKGEEVQIKVEGGVKRIVDIDFNDELIAVLDIEGSLVLIEYKIKEGESQAFKMIGKMKTDLDQVFLCKTSNILYGAIDISHLIRYSNPKSDLKKSEKIYIKKEIIAPNTHGQIVFTIAEIEEGVIVTCTSTQAPAFLTSDRLLSINVGNDTPLALLYLPSVGCVLTLTSRAAGIISCKTGKRDWKPCSFDPSLILADVPALSIVFCLSNGALSIIGYNEEIKIRKLDNISNMNLPLGFGVILQETMNSVHVCIKYKGKYPEKHDYSLKTISDLLNMPSNPIVEEVRPMLMPNPSPMASLNSKSQDIVKQLSEKHERALEQRLASLEQKIAQDIASRLEKKISKIIETDVEKHFTSIEENIAGNLQRQVDKCVDPEKITNNMNAISERLQDNLTFMIQKTFIPSFEESCNKMFKEMSKTYKDGVVSYKQKLDVEENALKEFKLREESSIKRNADLAERMEGVIGRQMETMQKVEDLAQLKIQSIDAKMPKEMIKKAVKDETEEVKEPFKEAESPEGIKPVAELFSKVSPESEYHKKMARHSMPPQMIAQTPIVPNPSMDLKSLAPWDLFNMAIVKGDVKEAFHIAKSKGLKEIGLIKILETFDEDTLKRMYAYIPQKYLRSSLREIVEYIFRSNGHPNPNIDKLLRKGQNLITPELPSSKEYGNYQLTIDRLNQFWQGLTYSK